MNFNEQNEYYLVSGWYEKTNGMHGGSFYGAVATPADYLHPQRVVVTGDDAATASEAAVKQSAKVYPQELLESDAGGLNPRERQETRRMLLDREAQGREYRCAYCGTTMDSGTCPHCHGTDRKGGPPVDELDEMTGSGGVAMSTAVAVSPNNTAKLGMPDRGGHGDIKNKGNKAKRVKTGRNSVKSTKKNDLKGFGGKSNMPGMSQSGGRRGGNQ